MVYSCSCSIFILYVSVNSDSIFGSFLLSGPYWAIFGVGVGFSNWFGVYSCSWTTFIFFVSLNSDIWFLVNFGVIFTFLDPKGLILGLGKGSKNVLGSTHVVEQLSFCMFLSILTFDFDLILGSFLTFWGPDGLFFGQSRIQKLFLGLLM